MSKNIYINEYYLQNPKVQNDFTFVNLCDIHSNYNILSEIYNFLKLYSFSFICIPGDVIDRVDIDNSKLLEELKKLSALAKLYVSLGNHDVYTKTKDKKSYYIDDKYEFFHILESIADAKVFKSKFETVFLDDITISAINYPFKYYLSQNKENDNYYDEYMSDINFESKDKFNILLSHSPNSLIKSDHIIDYNNIINMMNLILCGHNHGGLVLPKIQDKIDNHVGLVGPNCSLLQKNAYGTYLDDDRCLIISNGVTKICDIKDNKLKSMLYKQLNKTFPSEVDLIHVCNGSNNLSNVKRNIYKI